MRAKRRTLTAILLNPALKPAASTITVRNLQAALPIVRCDQLCVANLIDVPTKDQAALSRCELKVADVTRSRELLQLAIAASDEILLAWGAGRLTGATRTTVLSQADWVREHLMANGISRAWMVAGTPRHPSRWRQYVGPEKQRVQGTDFEARLAQVLASHNLESQAVPSGHSPAATS